MSPAVFTRHYNQGLVSLSESMYYLVDDWVNGVPNKNSTRAQRMLYLYLYAMESWQQDDAGNSEQFDNALTESQLGAIIARIKELS